jgi:nifR3 family TIM-barrel protein
MTDAARWLQDHGASLIDLNMGCPQRKISARGAGAGLLRQPAAAVALTARIVGAVGVPVTVKIRLGWDRDSLVAVELARELERAGIAALTVHGRTRGQGYLGEADRDAIGQVVAAVSTIPVIGNGDILSPETARRMLTETGCAGIMLGRGALREPWLIRDIWQALQGLPPLPPPARGERLRLMLRHLDAMLRHYGEPAGAVLFRKWIPHYAAKLGWPRPAMVRLLHIADPADLRSALNAEG